MYDKKSVGGGDSSSEQAPRFPRTAPITGSDMTEVAKNFSIKFPHLIVDKDSIEIVKDAETNIVIASVYNMNIDRLCTNFALGILE